MRFVIQRVTEATCEVDRKITGQITNGFCVLELQKPIPEPLPIK